MTESYPQKHVSTPTCCLQGFGSTAIHVPAAHHTHGPQSLLTHVCAGLHIPPHKPEQVILAYKTHVHRHWVIAAYPQPLIYGNIPVSSKHPHLSLKTHCTRARTDVGLWALSFSMYEYMHAHNLSLLAISMQLLEYMQATTTLHPYVSRPIVVCLSSRLIFFLSAIYFKDTYYNNSWSNTNFSQKPCLFMCRNTHTRHMQIP